MLILDREATGEFLAEAVLAARKADRTKLEKLLSDYEKDGKTIAVCNMNSLTTITTFATRNNPDFAVKDGNYTLVLSSWIVWCNSSSSLPLFWWNHWVWAKEKEERE